eukprot:9253153-Heterocapsa_arctica.AAC.1
MGNHNGRPQWEKTANHNWRPQRETTLGDHTGNSVERTQCCKWRKDYGGQAASVINTERGTTGDLGRPRKGTAGAHGRQ